MSTSAQGRQRVQYVRASDGTRLAWADSGAGPPVVKAANWLTHLEYEWESPVWKHWIQFFSQHWRFIRFDERGCGMSEWRSGGLTIERWAADLETILEAARPSEPVTLLGVSQRAATCIAYATAHPERVARMILYGGYARGKFLQGKPGVEREYRAVIEVARIGWGSDNRAFRQLFTSRFIPEGTHEQIQWFNELCRKTAPAHIAAELMESRAVIDVTHLLGSVVTPTLVLHARNDKAIPFDEGRILAAGIPHAEFVELDSRNHILLEHEPAWAHFQEAVLNFMGAGDRGASDSVFASLSTRERQVLALMSEGLANTDIAERLSISEKTVRNHTSNIFDKLGVWSRAQAIVFARDHGFSAQIR
ncbi:MAG: helix-turn-helix transcriptional regulator [Acidobacteria bacterium]|nr:MAG: helix-turn-helix transcriptional regulator [Acidobacteriota bacterium]